MMLVTLIVAATLSGAPEGTADAADTLHKEVPAAPDAAGASEAEKLEADMKKASGQQASPAAAEAAVAPGEGEPEQVQPGDKKETTDWADDKRWRRYRKRSAKPEDNKETGDWADESRWQRYRESQPTGEPPPQYLGAERPPVLRHRVPGIGAALGGVVGFGSGYYYAGEARRGLVFSIVDPVLLLGIVTCEVALNQLVIDHDLRSHRTLAPFGVEPGMGERSWGQREATLGAAVALLTVAELASHLFQAVGGFRAARRTNRTLDSFTFVPTDAGGAFQYQIRW